MKLFSATVVLFCAGAVELHAMTVNTSAMVDTFLTLPGGTVAVPQGNLIEIGVFSISDSEIQALQTGGTVSQTNANTLVASFIAFGGGLMGDGTGVDGAFTIVNFGNVTGFFNQPIYLMAFDAPTAGAAHHVGVFKGIQTGSAAWVFPPSDIVAQSVDCTDVSAGGVLIGAYGAGTLNGAAYALAGNANALELAQIPSEASTNFTAVAGIYSGLVQSNTPSPETTGFITITMANTGSFSAALTFGSARLVFKGKFDDSGDYSTSLVTKLGLALSIALHAESVNGTDRITGTVFNGSFTSDLIANRSVFNPVSNPATQFQGYYTLLLLPDSAATSFPQGNGYGVLTVDAGGTIKLKGALGDGTKIKQTATISEDGSWPVYIPLYANKRVLSGWLTFTNIVGVSDLCGTLTWAKPAQSNAKLYRNGFTDTVTLKGARYTPPPFGTSALAVSNALCNVLFTAGQGNLSSFLSNSITLNVANKVSPCVADKSKFKITSATGLFSGSFPNPATGKSAKFSGAILQKQNLGAGFFLGTDQSGFVTLEPAP
jgi:hypothetical protein